jgi:NAD(P)H-hydrate epimerase
LLPARPVDGHKGTFGTALICAGQAEYWGAPVLAGLGALRAGAGLVSLAVPAAIRATAAAHLIEATYPPVPDAETLTAASVAQLQESGSLARAAALLVGPGMGPAEAFLLALLATDSLPPLVLDADGLNLLAAQPDWPSLLPANTILTPHPGELARLMDLPLSSLLERDRVALALAQAQAWGQVLLLKGAYTVVAAPDGRTTLLPFANPALATGGSGDVLGGIIASLLAQGLAAYEAAVLGGFLHGAAAGLAAAATGNAGVPVHEIAAAVPEARHRLARSVPV